MAKLIWMSDLHFVQRGNVLGHDPRVRLQAAVKHINAHHADAEMCIVSGDVVNRGTRIDYEGVVASLDNLIIPYFPMVGNHDNRDLFRTVFSLPDTCMPDFVQYKVPTTDGIAVCLDTLKSGSDGGEYCQSRSKWLRNILTEADSKPVLVFMHHPPMSLDLPMQDTDKMENGQAFLDLIAEFACIRYLCIGHVHRPITGSIGGVPFATMRSVLYQAPPPRPEWTWDTFKPGIEAPNIGIIQMNDVSVTLQYEQFCEYPFGVTSA